MGVQLDLAGHVEDDEVFFRQRIEGFSQPVKVLEEEFEAVDEAAVGAEADFFHGVFEGDEFLDVEVGGVFEGFGGGVEVDVEGGAAVEVEMGDEGCAEGGLGSSVS